MLFLLIVTAQTAVHTAGDLRKRQRLGGLLNYYSWEAA
jgi:hypothetical protein